jgi:uncharacterized protein YgbK (DUF1537 family)
MQALRFLADDLTGACDVGAEMLPWPGGVAVDPGGQAHRPGFRPDALWIRNTQSRTMEPALAARRVTEALGDVGAGWAGIVVKKIDTGLRGQLGAEIDAAMEALRVEESFILPAIPEVGRTTQDGNQLIAGIPVHHTAFARDPHNPISDSSVLAAVEATSRRRAGLIGLAAVRGEMEAAVEEARARGETILVCDSETEKDLERAVRGLLRRGRPLLLVGSTGLSRALRRVLGTEQSGRVRPWGAVNAPGSGVLVVAGSAHPTTRAQIERAAARGLIELLPVREPGEADAAGMTAGRLLRAGHRPALVAPDEAAPGGSRGVLTALRRAALVAMSRTRPAGVALIGGETAYEVLEGLGLPPLWLETRLCPLVVRGRLLAGAYAGCAVLTKGGSAGTADLLGAMVRQLNLGNHGH